MTDHRSGAPDEGAGPQKDVDQQLGKNAPSSDDQTHMTPHPDQRWGEQYDGVEAEDRDLEDHHAHADPARDGGGNTRSTGDQIGGQSGHSEREQRGDVSGLPEDNEADREEQAALKGVSEVGDDPALDDRLSDDKEG